MWSELPGKVRNPVLPTLYFDLIICINQPSQHLYTIDSAKGRTTRRGGSPLKPVIITLTPEELQKCRTFSIESARSQQDIEFGQSDTIPRSVAEIARDNLIGKMAEAAFKNFLRSRYGVETQIDYNIYRRGVWDNNDLTINGWNIDIKSTRSGHWFLIEWNKLSFRRQQNSLPDCFFICRTPWNLETDTPKGTVELCGAVSLQTLCRRDPRILTLRKGELLPGTRYPTPLQADNYAIEFTHLSHNWDVIIRHILSNPPADQRQFVHFPFE